MATILIVDDRPLNREYLITLLGYAGHRLLEAASAGEALAHARAERPDLMIADIVMPDVDGFALVRQIREEPAIAQTRIIFYTATYLRDEARALAESCGVSQILTKPAEPQQIIDAVDQALAAERPAHAPPPAEQFEREHSRLLLSKLTEKVNELEAVNAELEQRVEARTAELATANAHLQQLNQLKDEMLVIASHDMRSPLSAILLMAELLLEEREMLSAAHQGSYLKHIHGAARHMLGLISDLLDLAKIESGQIELNQSEVYLSDLARRAIESTSFAAHAKAIDLRLVIVPGEIPICADRLKISQVLHNLLNNAIKFTPQGGQVVVTIQSEPGGAQVSVDDTGLGMAQSDLTHVFGKFTRAHRLGTAGEQGSGLGLRIVQQLVQLHGGSIEVASEVGRGSTFTVHLPPAPARP